MIRAAALVCLILCTLLIVNVTRYPLERVTVTERQEPPPAPPARTTPPPPPPPPPPPSPRITLRPSRRFTAAFDVLIDGDLWLAAGGPTQVRHDGVLHSSDPASGGERQLQLLNSTNGTGADALGTYARTEWAWRAGTLLFRTAVRLYAEDLVFEQQYDSEARRTAGPGLSSSFPAFALPRPAPTAAGQRYYLQWDGDMAGQLYRTGAWGEGARLGSGLAGTSPLVIFSAQLDEAASVVLGPLSSFMVAAQLAERRALRYGLLGSVEGAPARFSLATLLTVSRGVRRAVLRWGDALLATHGKAREGAWRRDATLRTLGYATDNGAYYYYNVWPDRGKPGGPTYAETIAAVAAYAREQRIPYRYWLADSWWYEKGPEARGVPRPGVARWASRPAVLPRGLGGVAAATNLSLMAHNRYWSAATPYAAANGGAWDFALDRASGFALPRGRAFWDHLFARAARRGWRLVTYEQDWMNWQHERLPLLTRSATAGRAWLLEMGAAARDAGVSVQYCMAFARHALQSVEAEAVTQARGSGDYRAGNEQWRPLGLTALLLYAVGLAASKDTWWSTRRQRGNKWGDATVEAHAALQAAVATISRGPVMPSDAVGHSDAALIRRSATADGVLLHPARPAILLDLAVLALARGAALGEVWLAPSPRAGRRYATLFAARLRRDLALRARDLGYARGARLAAMDATCAAPRGGSCPAVWGVPPLPRPGAAGFALWAIAPLERVGWTLLGEVNKWVAVSPARIRSIATLPHGGLPHADADANASLRVSVSGAPGELVALAFAPPMPAAAAELAPGGSWQPTVVECTLPPSGGVVVVMPGGRCTPPRLA